jgi:hypothetical protein
MLENEGGANRKAVKTFHPETHLEDVQVLKGNYVSPRYMTNHGFCVVGSLRNTSPG